MTKLKKTMFIFFSAIALFGCGAMVSNTDKPQGVYLGGASDIQPLSSVELVETSPENTGQEVEGVSCKNKLWEPAPSREAAIEVAKREAARAGYSKLRITSVADGGYGVDLRRNCWSVVVAKGIAFN